jgi:hypothetical protein
VRGVVDALRTKTNRKEILRRNRDVAFWEVAELFGLYYMLQPFQEFFFLTFWLTL